MPVNYSACVAAAVADVFGAATVDECSQVARRLEAYLLAAAGPAEPPIRRTLFGVDVPGPASESDEHFAGVAVGPDDFLVLMPRGPVSPYLLEQLRDKMPEALRGRVLVVDNIDASVLTESLDSDVLGALRTLAAAGWPIREDREYGRMIPGTGILASTPVTPGFPTSNEKPAPHLRIVVQQPWQRE